MKLSTYQTKSTKENETKRNLHREARAMAKYTGKPRANNESVEMHWKGTWNSNYWERNGEAGTVMEKSERSCRWKKRNVQFEMASPPQIGAWRTTWASSSPSYSNGEGEFLREREKLTIGEGWCWRLSTFSPMWAKFVAQAHFKLGRLTSNLTHLCRSFAHALQIITF